MVTYFWEFFGPDALDTARHFEVHLLDFLKRHALAAAETGVLAAPGQAVTFASVTAEPGAPIEASLRPGAQTPGPLPHELRASLVAPG